MKTDLLCITLMFQCPPANEDTLALREACLLDPLERPPKHCMFDLQCRTFFAIRDVKNFFHLPLSTECYFTSVSETAFYQLYLRLSDAVLNLTFKHTFQLHFVLIFCHVLYSKAMLV